MNGTETSRSTPWRTIAKRVIRSRWRGLSIRVQVQVDHHGEPTWMHLGVRRGRN